MNIQTQLQPTENLTDNTPLTSDEIIFLAQSNAIEGVYDADSEMQAGYAWRYLKSQPRLTLPVILKTHKILMLHQPLMPNEKGYFREVPVYIGGREGLDWRKLRTALKIWAAKMNLSSHGWKELHIEYEKIHPFVDGNGRTGRMFMNWHRANLGLPILTIHTGPEQKDYYNWF